MPSSKSMNIDYLRDVAILTRELVWPWGAFGDLGKTFKFAFSSFGIFRDHWL
jgi:hypothetical protein